MKLQRREKILAGVTLGIVGLLGLWLLFVAGDSRSVDQLIADQTKYQHEIETKNKEIQVAGMEAKRLAEWQRHALPRDPDRARTLYQNWLLNLARQTNLSGTRLTSNEITVHHGQFAKISCKLDAKAKLGDLVEFLYEFYAAGFLHQIHQMALKPSSSSRDELDVNLTIEAISLPTAESKDELPKKQEAVHKLADYHPIVTRNFFAVYVPPARERPPIPPKKGIDPADYTSVTAFVEVDGAAQVWIWDRMGEKSWKLGTGDSFTVGNVKGTVLSIRPLEEVVVEFDGHRRVLHFDNLHGGVEIPNPQPNKPDKGGNSPRPVPNRGI